MRGGRGRNFSCSPCRPIPPAAAAAPRQVRATLGEISTALGDVFGYHRGGLNLAGGAYAAEFGDAEEFVSTRKLVDAFAEKAPRPGLPRARAHAHAARAIRQCAPSSETPPPPASPWGASGMGAGPQG